MFTEQLTKRAGAEVCNSLFTWFGNSRKQQKVFQITDRKCGRGGSTCFWNHVSTCSLRNRLHPVWLAWTWGSVHAAFDILDNHTEEQESWACPSCELTPASAAVQYFGALSLSFRLSVEKQEYAQFLPSNDWASMSRVYVHSLCPDDWWL